MSKRCKGLVLLVSLLPCASASSARTSRATRIRQWSGTFEATTKLSTSREFPSITADQFKRSAAGQSVSAVAGALTGVRHTDDIARYFRTFNVYDSRERLSFLFACRREVGRTPSVYPHETPRRFAQGPQLNRGLLEYSRSHPLNRSLTSNRSLVE